ncbi:MAG: hypothetical protein AAGA93_15590 [Actinomycetota bacterium]
MTGSFADPTTPPPPPAWQGRVDRARATILDNRPGELIESQLGTVQRSLSEAEQDRRHLHRTLSGLDQAKVSADLKAALRSPDADPALVASLRRRHETVNDLLNRLDQLDQQIEATVADLETLAIRTGEFGLRAGDDAARREIDQLALDVQALEAAHREIEHL